MNLLDAMRAALGRYFDTRIAHQHCPGTCPDKHRRRNARAGPGT